MMYIVCLGIDVQTQDVLEDPPEHSQAMATDAKIQKTGAWLM